MLSHVDFVPSYMSNDHLVVFDFLQSCVRRWRGEREEHHPGSPAAAKGGSSAAGRLLQS